jgi:hypothetical protein
MTDTVLKWIGLITVILCAGCLALGVLCWAVMAVFAVVIKRDEERRRREFADVAAFREVGDETVILQEGLEQRLKGIGHFTMVVAGGTREIIWVSPPGLVSGFAPVDFTFVLEPDNVAPDEEAFRLIERFRERSELHFRDLRQRLIDAIRAVESGLSEEEALRNVEALHLTVRQHGYGEGASHALEASFDVELDPEHGYYLVYDPDTDRFGDWEDA